MSGVASFDVYVSQNTEESGYFLIEVPEIDQVTQARWPGEVEQMARELIAVSLDIEPDSFTLTFPRGRI